MRKDSLHLCVLNFSQRHRQPSGEANSTGVLHRQDVVAYVLSEDICMKNSESQKTTASTSAMQSPWDFWE